MVNRDNVAATEIIGTLIFFISTLYTLEILLRYIVGGKYVCVSINRIYLHYLWLHIRTTLVGALKFCIAGEDYISIFVGFTQLFLISARINIVGIDLCLRK